MSIDNMTILVTGATGNIGTELVHRLSIQPAVGQIRAVTRNPHGDVAKLLTAMAAERVAPASLDPGTADSLEQAFAGVDVLCLITPLGPGAADWQEQVLSAAQNVKRIVKVSVDAAAPEAGEGPGALHWAGEEQLRAMDVEHAIVRPSIFMQHFLIVPGLYTPGDDRFFLPISTAAMAMLDCRDIARLVAELAVCDTGDLPRDPVPMTGPQALTGDQLAAQLSAAAGRPIVWDRDEDAFLRHSRVTGSPEELLAVYQAGAAGAFADPIPEPYESLTGHRPTSFAKFAADYADRFRARPGQ